MVYKHAENTVLMNIPLFQTISVLASFILAMVLHPEVYHKAQEEMDRVIGKDALPSFSDRESLPYFECVLKEVLR